MKYTGNIIENSEGCKLTAYQDSGYVWTIGYGHTGGVCEGDLITPEQAEDLLHADAAFAEDVVNRMVKVPLNQNQFNALVDFVFNVGSGAFAGSTLLRLLNAGDYVGAAGEFHRWDMDNGKHVAGLLTRRLRERDLFNA